MKINKDTESLLKHSRLLEVLNYDYLTGIFTWKLSIARATKIGSIAGNFDKSSGYLRIQIEGRRFLAHRLAWFYCFNEWPEDMIDHKDLNKLNNSLDNLREADNSKNNHNKVIGVTNTSGYKGVSLNKATNKYRAQFTKDNVRTYLGEFDNIEEAIGVYKNAAIKEFGEFYNEGII